MSHWPLPGASPSGDTLAGRAFLGRQEVQDVFEID